MALGPRNQGFMGYGANGLAALLLGWLGGRMMGRRAGDMIALGGFVGLVMRIITEQTAIGVSLGRTGVRGLGDYAFAGVRGLRGFQPMDFFTPLAAADPSGQTAASQPPAMLTQAMAPAPPVGNGVSGLAMGRSRYGGSRVWG